MPRDVNGVYTLPAGNPVAAGTIIEADWCNTTMLDIAAALNTPPPVIEIPIEAPDGDETNPGLTFANEPTSGLFRDGFNTLGIAVGAQLILEITQDGIELAAGKSATGFPFLASGGAVTDLDVATGECFLGKLTAGAGPVEEISFPDAAAAIEPFLDLGTSKAHGQCRLQYNSTTEIELLRMGPGGLFIDGTSETVPAAGLTISNAGLAADTTYFVYAFMNVGVMDLELSTTVYDDDDGVKIKTGDSTRTLVGMIRTSATSLFVETKIRHFVRSWFNPGTEQSMKSVASGVFNGDINSDAFTTADWAELITWQDEEITTNFNVFFQDDGTTLTEAAFYPHIDPVVFTAMGQQATVLIAIAAYIPSGPGIVQRRNLTGQQIRTLDVGFHKSYAVISALDASNLFGSFQFYITFGGPVA